MAENIPQLPCPICGHEVPRTIQAQTDLLCATVVSSMIAALCHDMRYHVDSVRARLRIRDHFRIERGGETRGDLTEYIDMLNRDCIHMQKLWRFYWPQGRRSWVSLRNLPERVQWLCELAHFSRPPDFSPLRRARGRVQFRLYEYVFLCGVQGALITIGRDPNPSSRIFFKVRTADLATILSLTHQFPLEEKPIAWRALEWLIHFAHGTVSIKTDSNKTTVRWVVPIKE